VKILEVIGLFSFNFLFAYKQRQSHHQSFRLKYTK